MKIYINDKNEIKSLNTTSDETLKEIEVDREIVFGNRTDFMLLNYCYKQEENGGYSIYPARDYDTIVKEEYNYRIEELEGLMEDLKKENKSLKEEIVQIQTSMSTLMARMSNK